MAGESGARESVAPRPATARLAVDPLGERVVPTVFTTKFDWSGPGDEGPEEGASPLFTRDVLLGTPSAAQAPSHATDINRQVAQVTLPSGGVICGHGLKWVEGHTPVVDWTPT